MQGFVPFKIWDETYVHEMHNPDKLILQRRVDGARVHECNSLTRAAEARGGRRGTEG